MVFRKVLPSNAHYSIRAPGNFYRDMREDVEILREHRRFSTCTTVILTSLDALAAGDGEATYGKFVELVERELPELCADLHAIVPDKAGGRVLYDAFRNGFSHRRGPKANFAIADDNELDGGWAGELTIEGNGVYIAINVEKLIDRFIALVVKLEAAA